MSLVYWDTMLFIYWLEAHPQHAEKVEHAEGLGNSKSASGQDEPGSRT